MPDNISSRIRLVRSGDMPPPPIDPAPFVELGVTTPFSFLRGASDADSLVLQALALGMDAIGIADRNTLAGVVRLHNLGKMRAPKGECELTLDDVASHSRGIAFIAWPNNDLDAFEAELPR